MCHETSTAPASWVGGRQESPGKDTLGTALAFSQPQANNPSKYRDYMPGHGHTTNQTAKLPRHYRPAAIGLLLLACGALAFNSLPKPPLSAAYPSSTAVYARYGELLRLTLAADGQYRLWLPMQDIPPALRDATLLYEDRWFYRHPGFNPLALLRAAWATYAQGGRQGGSTLTMQLARQLYRIDSRGIPGKLRQITAALWLELRYRKDELLEAYLNTAPYGGNVTGVGAASLVYFHKPASRLTLGEALALAVIPQNPLRRAPHQPGQTGTLPAALHGARQRLWQRWLETFPQDRRQAADLALPLALYAKADKPFLAPHLATWLLQRHPGGGEIHASIDLGVQRTVERQVGNYLALQRPKGIRNAAVLLLDSATMQVEALLGSADFWDAEIAGQVNGVFAKRSPGSTLKPFVYGLGLDQGLLHPRTVLADAPTRFGAYSPENFDGRFVGPISAEEALVRSRNVPALAVAAQLSKPNLYSFLQHAGIAGLADERHYGLSLALGGGEVTLEELAGLYAMLANRGVAKALQYRRDAQANAAPLRLLSEDAAFITLDMLAKNPRPDSGRPAQPPVAWKTGTSWGFHDAWAVGVAGRHVLAAWVGNFDGSGNPALVGAKAAAPLFFSLVDALRAERRLPGLDDDFLAAPPPGIKRIDVCAASGDLPNRDCPALAKSWFIPGKSPIKPSTLHRAVYFDPVGGTVACPGTPGSRKEIFEFWPSDLARLFQQAGMPRRAAPPLPDCYDTTGTAATGLRIVAPSGASTYTLRLGKPASIGLRADLSGGGTVFWFAGQSYLGNAPATETFPWIPAQPGRQQIRAVDSLGRSATREVSVEFVP